MKFNKPFAVLLLILSLLTLAKADCDQSRIGYDCQDKWEWYEVLIIILGYTMVFILITYVIIRLFIEERQRHLEFTQELHKGDKYGITVEKIKEMEAERKRREAEEAD